jgi:hypothetical protein
MTDPPRNKYGGNVNNWKELSFLCYGRDNSTSHMLQYLSMLCLDITAVAFWQFQIILYDLVARESMLP